MVGMGTCLPRGRTCITSLSPRNGKTSWGGLSIARGLIKSNCVREQLPPVLSTGYDNLNQKKFRLTS